MTSASKPSQDTPTVTKRSLLLLLALGAAAVGGLVFSALLYHDSASVAAGAQDALVCSAGNTMSCAPALESEWAKVGPIPLPALAAAYYFSVLAVLIGGYLASRRSGSPALLAASRYLFATYAASVLFSAVLGYVAFFVLPTPCPFCIGLYVVNGVSFALAWALGPQLKQAMNGLGAALRAFFADTAVIGALAVFVVALVTLQLSYSGAVERAAQADRAQARADGQELAASITGEGSVQVELEGLPFKGNPNAPVKLVEFSDFECPYCGLFAQTVAQVHKAYPEQVAVYFVHFPLDSCNPGYSAMHPSACFAARAAICAQAQGKFWELHDEAFAFFTAVRESRTPTPLDEATVLTWAPKIGLDPERFVACLSDPSTQKQLDAHIARGQAAEFKGVPSWTLNGHLTVGGRPFDYIQPLVEKHLSLKRGATP